MNNETRRIRGRSVQVELTPEQEAHLRRAQEEEERCLPESIEKSRKLRAAAEEPTLSGALRRAVHTGRPTVDPAAVAKQAGITPEDLDAFLTGERPLTSDAMDRLAEVVGCRLVHLI